jgi:hypothetical protein
LGAAMPNLYAQAQELKMLGHHDIVRSLFS